MTLRIAASPIDTSVAVGDGFPRAPDSSPAAPRRDQPGAPRPAAGAPRQAPQLPLPSVAGEAFAAAVIAGRLPPRPATAAQLRQRLGAAWAPPASPFQLTDKTA